MKSFEEKVRVVVREEIAPVREELVLFKKEMRTEITAINEKLDKHDVKFEAIDEKFAEIERRFNKNDREHAEMMDAIQGIGIIVEDNSHKLDLVLEYLMGKKLDERITKLEIVTNDLKNDIEVIKLAIRKN